MHLLRLFALRLCALRLFALRGFSPMAQRDTKRVVSRLVSVRCPSDLGLTDQQSTVSISLRWTNVSKC